MAWTWLFAELIGSVRRRGVTVSTELVFHRYGIAGDTTEHERLGTPSIDVRIRSVLGGHALAEGSFVVAGQATLECTFAADFRAASFETFWTSVPCTIVTPTQSLMDVTSSWFQCSRKHRDHSLLSSVSFCGQ